MNAHESRQRRLEAFKEAEREVVKNLTDTRDELRRLMGENTCDHSIGMCFCKTRELIGKLDKSIIFMMTGEP